MTWPPGCPAAEALVLPDITGKTPGHVRAAIGRAVLRVDPDAARARREQAQRDARVELWHDAGTAALCGSGLPPDEALAADQLISDRAMQLKAAGLAGTMDQLRVRACLDTLLGQDSSPVLADPDSPARAGTDAPGPAGGPADEGPGDAPADQGPAGAPQTQPPHPATRQYRHPATQRVPHPATRPFCRSRHPRRARRVRDLAAAPHTPRTRPHRHPRTHPHHRLRPPARNQRGPGWGPTADPWPSAGSVVQLGDPGVLPPSSTPRDHAVSVYSTAVPLAAGKSVRVGHAARDQPRRRQQPHRHAHLRDGNRG